MIDHVENVLACRNRLLTLSSLPTDRAWENVNFTPTPGTAYIEEEYLPGPVQQITLGPQGVVESLPQYIVKLYGVGGNGVSTTSDIATDILGLFPPRQTISLSSGNTLQVRSKPAAPFASGLTNPSAGRSLITITIPLRARSTNST